MEKNIILIGMPASGKSTIGVILAKFLGYDFTDSDLVIQKKTGKRLPELIREYGVDGFIGLEDRINCSIAAEKTVIATGGSAVYGAQAMEHFRSSGTVIYLEVPFEDLVDRLGDIRKRGVVLREGQDLRALFEEREPLYRKYAHLVISEKGSNMEETLRAVLDALRRK